MPRMKGGRYERTIGFTPQHDKWINEQVGGGTTRNGVIEECIERVRRHREAGSKLDTLHETVAGLEKYIFQLDAKLDAVTARLKYHAFLEQRKADDTLESWFVSFEDFLILEGKNGAQ